MLLIMATPLLLIVFYLVVLHSKFLLQNLSNGIGYVFMIVLRVRLWQPAYPLRLCVNIAKLQRLRIKHHCLFASMEVLSVRITFKPPLVYALMADFTPTPLHLLYGERIMRIAQQAFPFASSLRIRNIKHLYTVKKKISYRSLTDAR